MVISSRHVCATEDGYLIHSWCSSSTKSTNRNRQYSSLDFYDKNLSSKVRYELYSPSFEDRCCIYKSKNNLFIGSKGINYLYSYKNGEMYAKYKLDFSKYEFKSDKKYVWKNLRNNLLSNEFIFPKDCMKLGNWILFILETNDDHLGIAINEKTKKYCCFKSSSMFTNDYYLDSDDIFIESFRGFKNNREITLYKIE